MKFDKFNDITNRASETCQEVCSLVFTILLAFLVFLCCSELFLLLSLGDVSLLLPRLIDVTSLMMCLQELWEPLRLTPLSEVSFRGKSRKLI